MSIFRNFDYNKKEISAIVVDENYGQYLWIAFKQDISGNCTIKKVSAHDLSQIYFDFTLAVTEIKKMIIYGAYLFVGVNHATNYLYRYTVANPLATPTAFTLPSGVIEAPVDATDGDSALWWLFPGSLSGENAKIVKTSTLGVFDETIDLSQSGDIVIDAKSLTYSNGDLWAITSADPTELWRVYMNSGGLWVLDKNEIT